MKAPGGGGSTPGTIFRFPLIIRRPKATREVPIARIVPEAHHEWMKQVACNLTDGLNGFLAGCRYLIHDRSSMYTFEFAMIPENVGIETVRLPARD